MEGKYLDIRAKWIDRDPTVGATPSLVGTAQVQLDNALRLLMDGLESV